MQRYTPVTKSLGDLLHWGLFHHPVARFPVKPIVTSSPPNQLWIDAADALDRIDKLLAENKISSIDAEQLRYFYHHGYVIISPAIDHVLIDQLREELRTLYLEKEKYLVRLAKKAIVHPDGPILPPKSRLLDLYAPSVLARNLVLAQPITRFLHLLYGEAPLAFQSLLFTWGSQQSIHKDTAFVVVDPSCTLTASWIALEDVEPGQGELVYYPGSHRDPLFLFSGQHLSWNAARDGKVTHNVYTDFLHNQARDKNIRTESFHAKKGDILIWHPNLAHGGAMVTQTEKTRFSLVTHYCPVSANPAYFSFFDRALKQPWLDGYYSSRRYDLRQTQEQLRPVVFN